jgi:hypothetical protein
MMIEARLDQSYFENFTQQTLHSIAVNQALKKAGIPLKGTLITHGIERGVMVWSNDEGLDGPEWVIQWADTREDLTKRSTVVTRGSSLGCSWVRYGAQAQQPDEDEL